MGSVAELAEPSPEETQPPCLCQSFSPHHMVLYATIMSHMVLTAEESKPVL